MEKKVIVLNYSGNVGKSTLARHLLAPRMQYALVAMESVNADGYSAPDDDARVVTENFRGVRNEVRDVSVELAKTR